MKEITLPNWSIVQYEMLEPTMNTIAVIKLWPLEQSITVPHRSLEDQDAAVQAEVARSIRAWSTSIDLACQEAEKAAQETENVAIEEPVCEDAISEETEQ